MMDPDRRGADSQITGAPGARVGMAGSMLGHYRVVSRLGAGGMGEVFGAEDVKLGRRVALKLLRPELADDPERLQRFQREARAVAVLNHPNIVTLYSVEETDGVQFLTMELVEGKTLADVIPKGGLPLDELLRLAGPLVEAVAFAHERGIVHRDLKPANVMLAADGRLKVLDFGLAKLKPQHSSTETTGLATQSLTQHHAVMGTAAYMSPEQAEGRSVDHRSDIFSLGVILYELACGQRPFGGDTAVSVISSVLKDTPPPVSAVNRAVPLALERVITRALAKDPAERYQRASELGDELKQVHESTASVRVVTNMVRTITGSRWTRRAAVVALVAAAAAAGWSLVPWRAPAALSGRADQKTFDPGVEQFPSLTPDGQFVVYAGQSAGNWDIYLLRTNGQNPQNLTEDSPADDDEPAVSRDGQWIAFRSTREGGGIWRMGLTGEGVRRVTPAGVSAAYNPTWSHDGTEIAYTTEDVQLSPLNGERRSELWIVNVATGQQRQLEVADGVKASWSPHGDRIAYGERNWHAAASRKDDAPGINIWTIPAGGGDPVAVTSDAHHDWSPVWSPDGRYVYFVSDRGGSMNLWRVAIDEKSGRRRGDPEPVSTPAGFLAHPSFSADGRLIAYSNVSKTTNIRKLTLDPTTDETTVTVVKDDPPPVTSGSREFANPDPTWDGEWVVFYSQAEGDVYVCRPDRTGLRSLNPGSSVDRVPRWSPDKMWVAFFTDGRGPGMNVWKIRADGSGLQRVGEGTVPVWSPDGSRMATSRADLAEGRTEIFATGSLAGSQPSERLPLPEKALQPFIAQSWSPDGTKLAGQIGFSDRGGNGIVLYTFASRTYERMTDFGEWPAWFADSRRLLFVSKGREFWVLDTRTNKTERIYSTTWDVLGPPRLTGDGRSVFYSRRVTEADIWLFRIGQ